MISRLHVHSQEPCVEDDLGFVCFPQRHLRDDALELVTESRLALALPPLPLDVHARVTTVPLHALTGQS